MTRGLVLGGGGVVGHAWEVGIVEGLRDAGVDLREADMIVGTSAGSIVGTRLAAGHDISQPVDDGAAVTVPLPADGPDLEVLGEVFARWSAAETVGEEFLLKLGELAGKARTVDEADWISAAARNVGVADWPEKSLRVISVDIESGHLGVHERSQGVALHAAVAASCAIPGMFPPIHVGGRRFMDGGVRSGTSADVLLPFEPALVVLIAPIVAGTAAFGALAERCIDHEVEALEAAGTKVVNILPDEGDKAAFGDNLMDASRVEAARAAGRSRGAAAAGILTPLWSP